MPAGNSAFIYCLTLAARATRVEDSGDIITLRARGPESKALLSVIASSLDTLNDSFRGLEGKVGKWIPCTCRKCGSATTPELFEEKRLKQRKRDNKLTIECPASYEDVGVLALLDGLKLEQAPAWAAEPRIVKVFLASSEELKEDRDDFDLYFRQQNDHFRKRGIYLEIIRWENFLDAMSESRLHPTLTSTSLRQCTLYK